MPKFRAIRCATQGQVSAREAAVSRDKSYSKDAGSEMPSAKTHPAIYSAFCTLRQCTLIFIPLANEKGQKSI